MDRYQARNITNADAGTTVTLTKSDYAVLHTIVINKADAHTLTIQDGNANVKGTLKASVAEGSYIYDIDMQGGIQIVVAASYAGDATVSFK